MSLKRIVESFDDAFEPIDEQVMDEASETESRLAKALFDKVHALQKKRETNIKVYEHELQKVIEKYFPDKSWWEVTVCNIFWSLMQTRDPEQTVIDILKGLHREFKEGVEDTSDLHEDSQANKEISDYQKWVDYDMKKYGKISRDTLDRIKKAGFHIVKDEYGDYEVISGKNIEEGFLFEDIDDKLVIYKDIDGYKVTPKSNYGQRISNARKIQDASKFDSAQEVIDYYKKWFGSTDDDFEVIDEDINEADTKIIKRYSDVREPHAYWYFTTHGIGPGTIPKDLHLLAVIEGQNEKGTWGDYVALDGILNTSELKWFDMKEMQPKFIPDNIKDKIKRQLGESLTEDFDRTAYTTLTDDEKVVIEQAAEEAGVDAKAFEKYVQNYLNQIADRREGIRKQFKSCAEMSYDDWKELRNEISIGSYFFRDYENQAGLDPRVVADLADGYIDYLQDYAEDTGADADELDTPDEFANYCYGIEWYDEDDGRDMRQIDQFDNNANRYRNDLFDAEEIYDLVAQYQSQLARHLIGEKLNNKVLHKKLTEGTSNFWSNDNFPLLVFGDYEEIYDQVYDMTKEQLGDDFDGEVDETKEFEDNWEMYFDYASLDEDEYDRLKQRISDFNHDMNADDRHDVYEEADVNVEIKPGYYEAYQIYVNDERYLSDWQIEEIQKFLKDIQNEFGLTQFRTAYRMNNGETGYQKVTESKLNEDKIKYLFTFTDGTEIPAYDEEDAMTKYDRLWKGREGATRSWEEIDKVAQELYDKRDDEGFADFNDEELAQLWAHCETLDYAYDDEVYDMIKRLPHEDKIFAKADEIFDDGVEESINERNLTRAERHNRDMEKIFKDFENRNNRMADFLKSHGVSDEEIVELKKHTGLGRNALDDKLIELGLHDEFFKNESLTEDIIKFKYNDGIGYTTEKNLQDMLDNHNTYFWYTNDTRDIADDKLKYGYSLPIYTVTKFMGDSELLNNVKAYQAKLNKSVAHSVNEGMLFKPMTKTEAKDFYNKIKSSEMDMKMKKIMLDDLNFFTDNFEKDYGKKKEDVKESIITESTLSDKEQKSISSWAEKANVDEHSLKTFITKYKKAYDEESVSDDDIRRIAQVLTLTDYDKEDLSEQRKCESIQKPKHIVNESDFDDIRIYMNTWANYNENGADLSKYGIESIADGWLTVDEALEFAEKYEEDEPFINDTDNVPFSVSEYDNAVDVLEGLKELQESNADEDAISAIIEAGGYDIQDAIKIAEDGDYMFFPDVDNDTDLGYAYIDSFGSLGDALGDRINDYIDEKAMRDAYEYDVRNMMYDDAKSRIADEEDIDEDDVTDEQVEDWIDNNIDDYLDSIIDEELGLAERGDIDLSDYFDYEAFGRDLRFDGFTYTDKGAISIY